MRQPLATGFAVTGVTSSQLAPSFRRSWHPLLMPYNFLLPLTVLCLLFRRLPPSPHGLQAFPGCLAGSPQHPVSHIRVFTAAVLYTLSHCLHQATSVALSPARAVQQQQPAETLQPTLLSLTALTPPTPIKNNS